MRLKGGRAGLLLAALLLALPGATAGTEAAPDVLDNPDPASPDRDLLAAWIEDGPDGLHVTIKIEGADRPPRDVVYGIVFGLDGRRYAPAAGADGDGALRSHFAMTNYDAQRIRGPETFADHLRDASFTPGAPAYVRFVIPFGVIPAFEPGAALVDLGAFTTGYDRGGSGWFDVDVATTTNDHVLQERLLPPGVRAALPWIGATAGALLLGAAGALMHLRRRKAQDETIAEGAPR